MKKIQILIVTVLISLQSLADEGMWLPYLLQSLNYKQMQALGLKLKASDIYSVNDGSLKDAIVQFGGGCTGEVISNQGLVLTNHHCGFGAIQRLSSLSNNYVKDGFWSTTKGAELPASGLTVTFIAKMEDVTTTILNGITNNTTEAQRQSIIEKNAASLVSGYAKKAFENVQIKSFYNGNMYVAITSVVYNDIRMVAAPPESIGAYGADTDNWVWPRHSADFSLFRIYANANNEPAAYSPTNKPYVPKRSLKISLKGVQEGDFTMVYGFPGRTTQYLPAIAVEQIIQRNNPIKIKIRTAVLDILKANMQQDATIKLQYASKYAGIANAWKKWQGESLGLTKTNAVAKKLAYENAFIQNIKKNTQYSIYANILPSLNEVYEQAANYFYVRDAFTETINNCEILNQSLALYTPLEKALIDGKTEVIEKEKTQFYAKYKSFAKDYSPKVDALVLAKLLDIYHTNVQPIYWGTAATINWNTYNNNGTTMAAALMASTYLADSAKAKQLLTMGNNDLLLAIQNDKAYAAASALRDGYIDNAAKQSNTYQADINTLQRNYMKAQLEVMKTSKILYPDANSTLRITYGKVLSMQPKDGVTYNYYTYLDGVVEKYIPNDYEYNVPAKLLELYRTKDYGRYGVQGKLPVCFIATNHTTGGNSGSPALDASGNLIGLNFDRAWEGTMSDINYDASICRNIMVDARYIVFIIEKFGGATHIIKELELVQ